MSEAWLDGFARSIGVEALEESEIESLLGVARDVAHGVERKVTPLATFLLGMSVQGAITAGTARRVALAAAIGELEGLIPDAPAAQ